MIEEDGSPPEMLREEPESRGPRAAIAPPRPDQRAIDFVRAGPDHSAVMRASVVGNAIPAARPPPSRATKSSSSDGAYAAKQRHGNRKPGPQDEQQLAPVAVADRTQVEHRCGEPQRVADRDQVESVCPASNALPMSGSATLATARFRLATAATRMSEIRTSPPRAGTLDAAALVAPGVASGIGRSPLCRDSRKPALPVLVQEAGHPGDCRLARRHRPALGQYHDLVHELQPLRAMRDQEDGAVVGGGQDVADERLCGLRVEVSCRLVENQDRGVREERACKHQSLALTARELSARLTDERVEAFGQRAHPRPQARTS